MSNLVHHASSYFKSDNHSENSADTFPANNRTFSERSKNVPSWFFGRFIKTFFGRSFVEGFGRP